MTPGTTGSRDLAMPKSMTLGTGRPLSSTTSTFEGLRSRCRTWCRWACSTPAATWRKMRSRSATGRSWVSQYSVIGKPATSSMAK